MHTDCSCFPAALLLQFDPSYCLLINTTDVHALQFCLQIFNSQDIKLCDCRLVICLPKAVQDLSLNRAWHVLRSCCFLLVHRRGTHWSGKQRQSTTTGAAKLLGVIVSQDDAGLSHCSAAQQQYRLVISAWVIGLGLIPIGPCQAAG